MDLMKKSKSYEQPVSTWVSAQTRKDYVAALINTTWGNSPFRVKDLYAASQQVGIGRSYIRTLVRILEKQDHLVRLSYGHYATMAYWKAQEQVHLLPSEGAA